VPAHTLTVAFNYPDYHAMGDKWQKIDFDNMAEGGSCGRADGITCWPQATSHRVGTESDPKAAAYFKVWETAFIRELRGRRKARHFGFHARG